MTRGLLSSLAVAALLAGGASARAADPAGPSWSGCHVGFHFGVGAGHTDWRDAPPFATNANIDAAGGGATAHTDMSGSLYGGQAGCDWQPGAAVGGGRLVLGVEAAMSGSTITGTNMDQFNIEWTLRSKVDWLANATGRVGLTAGPVLLYARAGLAVAGNSFEIDNVGTNLGTPSTTRYGWTAGPGVEWAFAPNASLFLQGEYYNFDGKTVRFPGNPVGAGANPPFSVKTGLTVETLKFGANYRF